MRALHRAGFEKPSAIQQKGIVPFTKQLDVIQQAQSGTGKTATFCAGILNNLDYNLRECQVSGSPIPLLSGEGPKFELAAGGESLIGPAASLCSLSSCCLCCCHDCRLWCWHQPVSWRSRLRRSCARSGTTCRCAAQAPWKAAEVRAEEAVQTRQTVAPSRSSMQQERCRVIVHQNLAHT